MKNKKIAAVAASLSLAVLAVPMSAYAAGTTYSTDLTTEETLTSTVLDKYLVMKESANVPNASFTFTVTPGAAVDADKESGKLAVIAGIGSPALTNGTMTFSASDAAEAEADAETNNDTPVFVTEDSADEKYVKKTLTIDFSDVAFDEPGIYRYIIEETGTNQGITNGYVDAETTETKRTLDVYVEDAGTSTEDGKPQLKITGYVIYDGEVTGAPNADIAEGKTAADKPNGAEVAGAVKNPTITNVYSSQELTFGKIVTGNQGSKDKYFDFTVEISNAVAGTVYTVDISNADAVSGTNSATIEDNAGKTNVDTITVPDSATSVTQHFYLQNGQYITIQGLAQDTEYKITENAEDYTSTDGITEALSTLDWNGEEGSDALSDPLEGKIEADDIHTGFTNDRTGAIPTGILTSVAGSAALVAVGIAGTAAGTYLLKKKKSEEE